MDLEIGKLYKLRYRFWETIPSELIVITGISEERDRITYYDISTGRLYSAFFTNFTDKYILSLT